MFATLQKEALKWSKIVWILMNVWQWLICRKIE